MYGPGDAPDLTGFETYSQVLKRLVEKIYKGHQMHCPACTFTSFDTGKKVEVKSVVMVPEKTEKPMRYSMMRDVCEELCEDLYSMLRDKNKPA